MHTPTQTDTHTHTQTDIHTHNIQYAQQRLGTDTWSSRNIQFLSRQKPRSNIAYKQYLRNLNGEVSLDRDIDHGEAGQLLQSHVSHKPGQRCQWPGGICTCPHTEPNETYSITPRRFDIPASRKILSNIIEEKCIEQRNKISEIVPDKTDLEILLINSCKIDAIKVQTILENFIIDKDYISLFCMTETKVRGHDFQPEGVKIYSKHRNGTNEKKGGGTSPRLCNYSQC